MLKTTLAIIGSMVLIVLGIAMPVNGTVSAQSATCTPIGSVTITNELSARNGVTANSNNVGITISEIISDLGGVSGQLFVLAPAQADGVQQWYQQAGLARMGDQYAGIYTPSGAQKWIEVNGGNPNGDNPVLVTLCAEMNAIPATISIGGTGGGAVATPAPVTTGNAPLSQPPAVDWPIWCDNTTAMHDGTVAGATAFAQTITSASALQVLVVNDQTSNRPNSTGLTLYEGFQALFTAEGVALAPGQMVLAYPGNVMGVCPWWTQAGGSPNESHFSFVVPDVTHPTTGAFRVDHHPTQWVEINGGNPDDNNAVVLVLMDLNVNDLP